MISRKFKSESIKETLKVEMRQDRKGDLFYLVSFSKSEIDYVCFENMSSVIDFIKSNF